MKDRNRLVFYVQSAVYNSACTLTSGTVFQTFMLESGIGEAQVSLCVSAFQLIQTAVTIAASAAAERIKNVLRAVAVCMLMQALMPAVLLALCLARGVSPDASYYLLFGVGALVNAVLGIYNILYYKQPHHLFCLADYGAIIGQSGVFTGITGAAVSAALSFALSHHAYFAVMTVVSIVCVALFLASGALTAAYVPRAVQTEKKSESKLRLLHYPPFYRLVVPNFLRGVSTGIIGLSVVIGYNVGVIDAAGSAVLATGAQIVTLVGCQTYAFAARKKVDGLLCLISSVGFCVCLPLMAAWRSAAVFTGAYLAAQLFNVCISYILPVIVARRVDYGIMARYTAWRMGMTTLGTALGGAAVPFLLAHLGAFGTLLAGGVAMLPCGVAYYLYDRGKKQTEEDHEN